MTDARLPDRWLVDRRFNRLTDEQFRGYIRALLWSVSNRTDGYVEVCDLTYVPVPRDMAEELVAVGLWRRSTVAAKPGWKITDFESTQTSANQLERNDQQRRKERERKAIYRAKKAAEEAKLLGRDVEAETAVPRDVTRDSDADEPAENPGEDRTGKSKSYMEEEPTDRREEHSNSSSNGWPEWQGAGDSPYEEYR